jgi:uncharacterized protein (TIGR03437 family)
VKELSLLFALLSVASAEPRMGRFVLILSDPPVARQVTSAKELRTSAAVDRVRAIQEKQVALADQMIPLGAKVLGSIQTIANELFVAAPDDQIQALRKLPGVAAVYRDIPIKPTMNRAADLMNATAAWTALGGPDRSGNGVRIGILDTGIDLNHPAFQDTTLATPSPAIDCTKGTGVCTTPNKKVIVTRNYMKQVNYYWQWDSTTQTPKLNTDPSNTRPDDPTERDHSGHGTAMAFIAAGNTVTGPNNVTLRGIAPKAQLGIYKIFGSPGLNEITYVSALQAALEDALLDGMNVAVLGIAEIPIWFPDDKAPSICLPENAINSYCDWTVAAVRNAVSRGLVVVTSAGNDGDLGSASPLGSISSPGTIPEAITVGAVTNSHIAWQTVSITGGSSVPAALQFVNAYFGNGPKPVRPVTAAVVDVGTLAADDLACSPLPARSLVGKIALIQRGGCLRDVKINNAIAAGVVDGTPTTQGVILYEDADHRDFVFYMGGLQNTGVPAVLIGNTAGTSLKNYLRTNSNVQATLNPAPRVVDTQESDSVPFFSSHGPSIDGIIKPELVATGTDLVTATQALDPSGALYNASGYTAAEGTSFAAAIVGGAAALVKQQHPNYTPAQVKSALVNTTNTRVFEFDSNGNPVSATVNAVGAGKLDVLRAIQSNVIIEPATASFGFAGNTVATLPNFRITNTGTTTLTLTLTVEPIVSDTVTQVLVSPSTVTLNPGQTNSTVQILVRGSPTRAGSFSGDVVIRGGASEVHVPYQYVAGDNQAFNILPTQGFDWLRPVNDDTLYISFRLMDRYGAPVSNAPHRFTATIGGGKILKATDVGPDRRAVTDSIGFAGANVQVGPNPGEHQFTGTAGGLTATFNGRARPRPIIATVTDAGTHKTGSFAPGSYIELKAPAGGFVSETTEVNPSTVLPVSLGGVAVSFDVPDAQISVPGHISYVSPTQVNVQVPWELQGQSKAFVKLMLWDANWNDTTSADPATRATVQVNLADTAPGFFLFSESFAGCACPAAVDLSGGLITASNPIKRGQFVQIYMNGLGPVTNQPASGNPSVATALPETKTRPTVTIGGVHQTVQFSGLAPGFVGLYQLNVQIADNTPTGIQPLSVSINGLSATSNLPIQ